MKFVLYTILMVTVLSVESAQTSNKYLQEIYDACKDDQEKAAKACKHPICEEDRKNIPCDCEQHVDRAYKQTSDTCNNQMCFAICRKTLKSNEYKSLYKCYFNVKSSFLQITTLLILIFCQIN